MKINFNQVIRNLKNEPMRESPDKESEEITLKKLAVNGLLTSLKGEEAETGEVKLKRFMLAEKIQAAESDVEVQIEDLKIIKERIGKVYSTILVGRAYQLLENNEKVA